MGDDDGPDLVVPLSWEMMMAQTSLSLVMGDDDGPDLVVSLSRRSEGAWGHWRESWASGFQREKRA